MKILVIHGGEGLSDEAAVSHETGAMIFESLQKQGFEVEQFLLTSENFSDLADKIKAFDLVWPALHGKIGEDGEAQKICEEANVAFVGSGSVASRLCFDKGMYKQALDSWGIRMPKSQIIRSGEMPNLGFPVCLKPIASGSSVDTFKINSEHELQSKLSGLSDKYPSMLLDEWVQGSECTVGILGSDVLPMVEIIPPQRADFFDLESKYDGNTQEICPPANIGHDIQKRAGELALELHNRTGCRHLSRTDMIFREGELYILETNTLPGMTPESLFPKAAAQFGLTFDQLVGRLVDLAIN